MKEKYVAPTAKIITLVASDVITSSIGEDAGENDGEWTAFIINRNKPTGIWE